MEKYGKYHDSTPYKLWVLGNRHKLVSCLYSGATVEVYSDEKKNFKGLFFQDVEMREAFKAYSEIIFIDATYLCKTAYVELPIQVNPIHRRAVC